MTLLAENRSAIFERGDFTYLVSSVGPFEPGDTEIDELSFAADLRKMAPNENLMWLRGTYVEGGPEGAAKNSNGQQWDAGDIAIKSLTPVFMPVTVMHDPRTAVGLIADTVLVLPPAETSAAKPTNAKIDNTLAVWKHRFPEVAEEISANYAAGTMMQSQECRPAYYDCGECGARFPKLPGCAERAQWCSHLLTGEVSMGVTKARRIFGNVTFTGTGLIFGSRGVKGALSSAKLELLQDEVSELHEKANSVNRDSVRRLGAAHPPTRRTSQVDIDQKEYEALVAAKAKADELSSRVEALEVEAAKVPELTRQVEALEIDKKKATDDLSAANEKINGFEETSRQTTLATERTSKLGKGFTAKLPETISARLTEQAKTLSDDDWSARLEELSELIGVKHDDAGESTGTGTGTGGTGSGSETFSHEETSRTATGTGGNGGGTEPSRAAVGAVVGGLLRRVGPAPAKEPAAK